MELVYFLQAEHSSLVKIGWTANIVQRIQKLRMACPYDVRLIGVRPGTKDLEAAYHENFAGQRTHAEWFNFDYEVMAWMQVFLRTSYADSWQEVERLFELQAPDLLRLEDRWGNIGSILHPCLLTVDPITRRTRKTSAIASCENGGGDE